MNVEYRKMTCEDTIEKMDMSKNEKKDIINKHIGKSMLTEYINGIQFGILDCTIEEYAKQVGAINIDDIQWTN